MFVMGKYINQTSKGAVGTSATAKCDALLADGAKEIKRPKDFVKNLVCVVDNGYFGAAAHAYTESELKAFQLPNDTRPKRWFIWDKVEEYAM